MSETTLHIKVSGHDVYKAVKNYINNSPEVQETIKVKVQGLVDDGYLKITAERLIKERLESYRVPQAIKDAAKEVITDEIRMQIDEQVKTAIRDAIMDSVFAKKPQAPRNGE